MRKRLALSGLILAFLAACAGSDGTDTDRIRLTGFTVAEDPKVDVRYPAVLAYEANGGVQVIDSCFLWFDKNADFTSFRSTAWLGEGPYCFAPDSGVGPNAVKAMLVTGYPGTYRLEGYVRYYGAGVRRTTDRIATEITVTRRLP
ncbi:MAG TPA: hypothetical protein VIS03_09420 [Kiloniellaceae bacterium]